MSITTVGDLLGRADAIARGLPSTPDPVTTLQWQRLDATAYRLLDALAYPVLVPDDSDAQIRLNRVRDEYPLPLTERRQRASFTPKQYAAHYGYSEQAVLRRVLAGTLPASKRNGRWSIGTADDTPLPDLAPADPTSPAPMDRLSVTLATMGDLLNTALPDHPASLAAPGAQDRTALAAHVLALTTVGARHALTRLPMAEAGRPLLIGRYAEHALDALSTLTTDTALAELATFHTPSAAAGPNEALEAALRTWAAAARAEVARGVPSTAVLSNIASQGVHLYAVTDQLTAAAVDLGRLPRNTGILARSQFRSTADALTYLAKGWATVTTAQPPTHAYATAATVLHETLHNVTHEGPIPRAPADVAAGIDLGKALVDLRYAGTDMLELTHLTRPLPATLARSELLFAPAKTVRPTPGRLHHVLHRRFVAVTTNDVTDLSQAAISAAEAVRRGRAAMARTAGPETGDEPQVHLLTRSRLVSAQPAKAPTLLHAPAPMADSVAPQL